MENALNLSLLLMTPIVKRMLQYAIPTASTSHGFIKDIKLINVVKFHIVTNKCERLEIIENAWKGVSNLLRLAQEINSFLDLVRSNINEYKCFINNVLLSFSQRLKLLYDLDKKTK